MFKFIAILAAVIVGGGYYLKISDPQAWDEITSVYRLLSGQSCAPDMAPGPVYMVHGDDCKPLEPMVSAPAVRTDGNQESANNIALLMANRLAFGEGRIVRIDYEVELSDLLEDGESMPEGAKERSDLARKRVAKLDKKACERLPSSFAMFCEVKGTRLDLEAASANRPILISHELTYAPSVTIGDIPEDNGNLRLFTEKLDLPASTKTELDLVVSDAVGAADQVCAEKRKQFGNCMIAYLKVSQRETPQVTVSWIAPDAAP